MYQHFASYGIKIYPQKLNTKDSIGGMLLSVFSVLPYKFYKYCNASIVNTIQKIVEEHCISKIWCNHAHMAWYALQLKKKNRGIKIYLREHNIEYSLVEQRMLVTSNSLFRLYIKFQLAKTKTFEIECWKKFDATFYISDSDLKTATTDCAEIRKPILLYDSFEIKEETLAKTKEPYSFIFTGDLKTFQNLYNLKTFIAQVWKYLVSEDKRWKLYVTGNSQDVFQQKIRDFAQYNIINLGFVEEIKYTVSSKKYFISPTSIGSGVRIKVLNALADGAVCFLTPLDAAMLNIFKDLDNVVEYSGRNDFLTKLTLLENNLALYNSISLQAKNIGNNFTWNAYAEKVTNELSTN